MQDSSSADGARKSALLTIQGNDHLAASVGGIELVKRMLRVHRGDRYEELLTTLLGELTEENESLRSLMKARGLPERRYEQVGLWVGETQSRAKPNGQPR